MKEFTKWYKNSGSAWSFTTEESKTNEQKFKVAWKTALVWALSQGYRADGQGSLESVIFNELEE